MEKPRFPLSIASLCAHDGIALIVERLLSDSTRLSFLYPSHPFESFALKLGQDALRRRAYWRSTRSYSPQAQIQSKFDCSFIVLPEPKKGNGWPVELESQPLRAMAHVCADWRISSTTGTPIREVRSLLLTSETLPGDVYDPKLAPERQFGAVSEWVDLKFRDKWLKLYTFARTLKADDINRNYWTLMLSTLAFRPENPVKLIQLLLLHAVAVDPDSFPEPPRYTKYERPHEIEFVDSSIGSVLKSYCIDFISYRSTILEQMKPNENLGTFSYRVRPQYDSLRSQEVRDAMQRIKAQWPRETVDSSLLGTYKIVYPFWLYPVNELLRNWYRNRELAQFLEKVESIGYQKMLDSGRCCPTFRSLDITGTVIQNASQRRNILPLSEHSISLHRLLDCTLLDVCRRVFDGPASDLKIADYPLDVPNSDRISAHFDRCLRKSWAASCAFAETAKAAPSNELPNAASDTEMLAGRTSPSSAEDVPSGHQHNFINSQSNFESYKKKRLELGGKCARILDILNKFSNVPVEGSDKEPVFKALQTAGLTERFNLRILISRFVKNSVSNNEPFKQLLGALVVYFTQEMRITRILRYLKRGDSMEFHLRRELQNEGHQNWSPAAHPEWLLFELERDLLIRPIQIDVANQMISPPNGQNAIVQLNMGEGKTKVIVPLLVTQLADGKQLCRITVLRSLLNTNSSYLRHVLGGLLNRRVYYFPCKREMKIGTIEAKTLLTVYNECRDRGGVTIALPEERLSFHLKALDECYSNKYDAGCELMRIEQWLRKNSREVLDEAEEILRVKFRLIYTVDSQLPVDNGALRWRVCQTVLGILRTHMEDIENKYGPAVVDFRVVADELQNAYRFPTFRLLRLDDSYKTLCTKVADDFLNPKGHRLIVLPDIRFDKQQVIRYLTEERPGDQILREIPKLFGENTPNTKVLTHLRGLLAGKVLFFVLNRRWRVNYGVDTRKNTRPKMAIPFRAKDVPVENTEFGHADVAILSTLLSYYYSGLNEEQLESAFERLAKEDNPSEEYNYWIDEIKLFENVEENLLEWRGVNLADCEQKRNLFELMKFNKRTINYWLETRVFPEETKQFPKKLVASFWDLVPEDAVKLTTGFSGTNDTQLLYPLNIKQRDIEKLSGTNGSLLRTLLFPENNKYLYLPQNADSENILKEVVQQNLTVILDVGALIIDSSNHEVAAKWLDLAGNSNSNIDAVVYFDENNKLICLRKDNSICDFDSSPFAESLDKCLVYLDEFHTRGTDLRIPRGSRAALTLGTELTKDRLFQAAMRMRLLGDGHSVSFFAAREVHFQIQQHFPEASAIGSREVIEWSIRNSVRFIRDGLPHWAVAGLSYIRKRAAREKISDFDSESSDNLQNINIGIASSSKELISLNEIYGDIDKQLSVLEIVAKGLSSIFHNSSHVQYDSNRNPGEHEYLLEMSSSLGLNSYGLRNIVLKIYETFKHYASNDDIYGTACLDEQQERELQPEVEHQRHTDRPGRATPYKQSECISQEVLDFARTGHTHQRFLPLPLTLKNTQLWPLVEPDAWSDRIRVSEDFTNVVTDSRSLDQYLRPPNWIISFSSSGENDSIRLLIVSAFEANELIPLFRKGALVTRLHQFGARLQDTQDLLLHTSALTIPPNSTLPYCELLDAQLFVFSGSMYFEDRREQSAYCHFLGLLPRPRTAEHQAAFERGDLHGSFVPPVSRAAIAPEVAALCRFSKNPSEFAQKIVETRFDRLPRSSHVSAILVSSVTPLNRH